MPMIVRWPGKVKAGTTSNQLIGNVDMLATFAALTGQTLDKAQQADSVNMLPAIIGEPEQTNTRPFGSRPAQGHTSVAAQRKVDVYPGSAAAAVLEGGNPAITPSPDRQRPALWDRLTAISKTEKSNRMRRPRNSTIWKRM